MMRRWEEKTSTTHSHIKRGIRFFSPPESRFIPLNTPRFTSPTVNMRETRKKKRKRYCRKRRNIEETNNQNCRERETSSHSLNKAVLSYTYPTAGVFSSICSNYLIPYPFELYSFMFHLFSLFYLISCMMHEFVWCSVLASSSLRIYDFTPHHNAPSLRDNTLVLYFLYFI